MLKDTLFTSPERDPADVRGSNVVMPPDDYDALQSSRQAAITAINGNRVVVKVDCQTPVTTIATTEGAYFETRQNGFLVITVDGDTIVIAPDRLQVVVDDRVVNSIEERRRFLGLLTGPTDTGGKTLRPEQAAIVRREEILVNGMPTTVGHGDRCVARGDEATTEPRFAQENWWDTEGVDPKLAAIFQSAKYEPDGRMAYDSKAAAEEAFITIASELSPATLTLREARLLHLLKEGGSDVLSIVDIIQELAIRDVAPERQKDFLQLARRHALEFFGIANLAKGEQNPLPTSPWWSQFPNGEASNWSMVYCMSGELDFTLPTNETRTIGPEFWAEAGLITRASETPSRNIFSRRILHELIEMLRCCASNIAMQVSFTKGETVSPCEEPVSWRLVGDMAQLMAKPDSLGSMEFGIALGPGPRHSYKEYSAMVWNAAHEVGRTRGRDKMESDGAKLKIDSVSLTPGLLRFLEAQAALA